MQKVEDKVLEEIGILKAILIKRNKENTFKSEILQIEGVQEMTYKNIKIKKNQNGKSWFARFRKNNKQYYISAKTQLGCYEKLKQAYHSKPIENKIKNTTLIEWYNKWLNIYKKDVKETTKLDYKANLKYIEEIKDREINKITAIDIISLLNKINFERRKQKVYEFLKDIFAKALNNDLISKNVLEMIEKPKHKKKNGNALTNNDEKLLEELFIKNKSDIFLVALYQGLRKGEVLALNYEDFDLQNKTLKINKSLNTFNEIDKTKNESSTREMPLFDKTIKVIEKYKNTKGRIFNYTQKECQKLFSITIRELNSPTKYTIHSLRHTFITKCQEKNIPLHIIQHWCGHVLGSKVTSSTYTHTRKDAELLYTNIINE